MKNPRYLIPILVFALAVASKAELLIPAYTAYLEPDAEGAEVSPRFGITGWHEIGRAHV